MEAFETIAPGMDLSRYEDVFTDREMRIIRHLYRGELTELDVVRLIEKAEYFEFYDLAEYIYDELGYILHPAEPGDPTPEEARAILDSLTPDDLKERK